MRLLTTCCFSVSLILMTVSGAARADVNDTAGERRLSVPGAPALVLPRSDWTLAKEQSRPGASAVYYMLTSAQRQMVFSVYIDRTETCRSAAACLDSALANPQYKDAKELRKSEAGPFQVAQFYLDNPQGAPIKQAQLSGSAYIDGVWFDVHLSKSASERPPLAELLEVLQSLAVR